MTTKAQEREALAKIRKIVDELGANSRVGAAFSGCFQDAEINIENSIGFSARDKCARLEHECETLKKELVKLREEVAALRRDAPVKEKDYRVLAISRRSSS